MEKDKLEALRREIDQLDDQVVDLLAQRFQCISEVTEVKKEQGMEPYQAGREIEILNRVVQRGRQKGLNGILLQAIFLQIFAVSKQKQN